MKASPENRISDEQTKGGSGLRGLLIAAMVVVVVAVFWFMGDDDPAGEPEPPPMPTVYEPEPPPPAPDIPEREPEPVAAEPEVPEEPPLALEDSDVPVREVVVDVSDSPLLSGMLASDNLVQRSTGMVDGLSRGVLPRKIFPLKGPDKPFTTVEENGVEYVNPESYRRYDGWTEAITSADTDLLAETFHQFRPLYEQAYGDLGLNPDDFDNAVIRALDRILATPEVDGPVALERKSVMYTYADPELEELTPLQKQLLRMGPENLRKIKQKAQALRRALLAE